MKIVHRMKPVYMKKTNIKENSGKYHNKLKTK